MVLISVAPLMGYTEPAPKFQVRTHASEIGSSNNLEETEDQTVDSTEENIDAASTNNHVDKQETGSSGCKKIRQHSQTETDTNNSSTTTTDSTEATIDSTRSLKQKASLMSTPSSSGTFEIAAGGGKLDDSIFQGDELAQMKMTRMKDPGLQNLEVRSLGIDLNGLDISGTADAAYYRAGTRFPIQYHLPEIGSSITSMRQGMNQQTRQKKILMLHRQNHVDKQGHRLARLQRNEQTTDTTETDTATTDSIDISAATSTANRQHLKTTTSSETATSTVRQQQQTQQKSIDSTKLEADTTFDVDTIFTSGTFEIAVQWWQP